ncbi:MAG TPA: molybdopterin-dependent oxidoreductase, partial [Terriglobia bacterium]|nr:molybdopterin-dependent oxidoreductase [Terriglobia bacterium]
NPCKAKDPATMRGKTFLVVQDLFLTETAQAADVVLPAASSYEKTGTKTNTCGEVQRLRKGIEMLGTRTDLRIFQDLAAALGASLKPTHSDEVFQEIHDLVPGYGVSLAGILTGAAEPLTPFLARSAMEGDGRGQIHSAGDTLFTSGTLSRYSGILQRIPERGRRGRLDPA